MDLLFVTRRFPPAPGGVENQVLEVASRLVRKGHQVRVLATDLYADIPFKRLPPDHSGRLEGVDVIRCKALPIPWRRSAGTSFAPSMLLAAFNMDPPQLVHCHGLNLVSVTTSLLVRQLHDSKAICTTHADPSLLSRSHLAKLVGKFDGVIALTEIERTQLLRYGVEESKIRLIPNGIDVDSFMRRKPGGDFRKKHGIANHLILYAGRIDSAEKGCAVLVEAVSLAQRKIGDCTLVFAGPDWGSEAYLRKLAQHQKVRALFTGNLNPSDLKSALLACDVFVLPSFVESFGVSILEALLSGVPVVATRVGGIPSIISDGQTGLLVDPGDHQQLADAIVRIIVDHRFSRRLAANGRETASRFSIEQTVEMLEGFYEDIVKRSSQAP